VDGGTIICKHILHARVSPESLPRTAADARGSLMTPTGSCLGPLSWGALGVPSCRYWVVRKYLQGAAGRRSIRLSWSARIAGSNRSERRAGWPRAADVPTARLISRSGRALRLAAPLARIEQALAGGTVAGGTRLLRRRTMPTPCSRASGSGPRAVKMARCDSPNRRLPYAHRGAATRFARRCGRQRPLIRAPSSSGHRSLPLGLNGRPPACARLTSRSPALPRSSRSAPD